jgi:hypothetical protein
LKKIRTIIHVFLFQSKELFIKTKIWFKQTFWYESTYHKNLLKKIICILVNAKMTINAYARCSKLLGDPWQSL